MRELTVVSDRGRADQERVLGFERSVDIKLPPLYRSFIANHNAAVVRECYFAVCIDGLKQTADVTFLGFGDVSDDESILYFQQEEYGHKGVVVFGITARGDYVCFDYRNSDIEPAVVLMMHDDYSDDGRMKVCPIADDFLTFWGGLFERQARVIG